MRQTLELLQPAQTAARSRAIQRVLLYANELYRVPTEYRLLRVVSGRALVTHNARDMILGAGCEARLQAGRDAALVSPLRGETVVMELASAG